MSVLFSVPNILFHLFVIKIEASIGKPILPYHSPLKDSRIKPHLHGQVSDMLADNERKTPALFLV